MMLAAKTITLSNHDLALAGYVVGISLALFVMYRLGKKFLARRRANKDAANNVVVEAVSGLRQLLINELYEGFRTTLQRDMNSTVNSAVTKLEKSTTKAVLDTAAYAAKAALGATSSMGSSVKQSPPTLTLNPPANDPGFHKPNALPSKLGEVNLIASLMGHSTLLQFVRDNSKVLWAAGVRGDLPDMHFLKQNLTWGTYGPNPKLSSDNYDDYFRTPNLQKVRLIDCDTSHLENIMATCKTLNMLYRHVILSILRDRYLSMTPTTNSGTTQVAQGAGRIKEPNFS